MYVGRFTMRDTEESRYLGFDFRKQLGIGAVISSVAVSVEMASGTDASASSRLVGSAVITGTICRQKFGNTPVAGAEYRIVMTATRDDGHTATQFGILEIVDRD